MASPVGLAIRNEKAQQRITDSLDLLGAALEVELPVEPARIRDPFLRETLRMEWTAETLEVLASASDGRIMPLPEQADQVVEQPGVEPEQGDADPEDTELDESTEGDSPDEILDPDELKKQYKLDELKAMAADRGIDGVQDARSKDEVIEKLMKGSE